MVQMLAVPTQGLLSMDPAKVSLVILTDMSMVSTQDEMNAKAVCDVGMAFCS